jgi:hypothetical protein
MFGFIRKSLILAAAALCLSFGAGAARAENPPQQIVAQPQQQDPAPAASKAEVVPAGGYTAAQLGDTLRNMGYDPKPQKNVNGGTYYTLLFERGTWTFSLTVVLSNDGTYLWLSSPLTQIPDGAQASPQALLKLMERNYQIGPSFFSFRPAQGNRIYLSAPIANHNLTPAKFRSQMDEFLSTIQETYPLWDKKAVIAAANAAPQKQASADSR